MKKEEISEELENKKVETQNVENQEAEHSDVHEHHDHEEKPEGCCHCHDADDDEEDENEEHEHHHHSHEHGHSHGHSHCHCGGDDDDDDDEEEEVSLPKLIIAAVLFVAAILIEKLLFNAEGMCKESVASLFSFASVQTVTTSLKAVYLGLYAVSYLLVGLGVLKEVVENLMHGRIFDEEFLMGVATIGAIILGEYSEGVAVMLLFQLGEFLEDLAVGKSRKSISSLMDIRPDKARVKKSGTESEEVLAETVKKGDVIIVKAGERVPLDGKIISGKTMLDTSALTGESVPVEAVEGNEVLSGVVNVSGLIEILVEKEFGESTVSRVLEMVENAEEKKAKAQKFITRFSKMYTPLVMIAALAVFVIPTIVLWNTEPGAWKTWLYRGLELLVVSCPCALVISVPLSFFAGIGLASNKGILIKGSNYLELLSKTNTVVFDKTGTLTKGVFEVTAIHARKDSGVSDEELVAVATHAEYVSNHPISVSLKKIHSCPDCASLSAKEAEEISGHGIKCTVEGKTVLVGNEKLMLREQVKNYEACQESDVGTIIHVARDGEYLGHIVISDKVKEDSANAISLLHKCGVTKTVMLTGDSESAANHVAKEIGIDAVYSQLLPQNKVEKIEELLEANKGTKKNVAFVGDGINDAPVLTRSDVGIAMGGLGSDAAIEAADVVIMDDMPSKVSTAVKIAKKTMLNVKENVTFALLVKLVIMILCTCGIANMWIAVFGDVGVTMLAVLNAMRLLAGSKRRK